jgi:T-complex protein 1 subunit beta
MPIPTQHNFPTDRPYSCVIRPFPKQSSFVGAIAIGDLVKSTLGPKGMDKILQSYSDPSKMHVTNDGATILKSIGLDNPAAKVLVEMSRVQDDEVGDGTTSVTVLASELLRASEGLVQAKIHPQTIIAGFLKAVKCARAVLESEAIDHGSDPVEFRKDLINIARTTLSSKILNQRKQFFSEMAVDAVMRLKSSNNMEAIQIIKVLGGTLSDSYLDEGFLLAKTFGVNQPKRIENARIMIANTSMDTDKVKVFGTRVRTESAAKVAEIEAAEKNKMKEKVDAILKHDINCFINRQLIYNWPEQLFADAGVSAIEHADFEGVERLSLVLGGDVLSTFDSPGEAKLGTCDLIEEVMIGEDKLIRFSGVPLGEACTVVLRGATRQILDEAERSFGGGCAEMLMANAIQEEALKTPGKEAVAMEAFSAALRVLPTTIADNGGYDSSRLISELRAEHKLGHTTMGLDMETGEIADVKELGITESYKVKSQVVVSAAEAAEMILRVDSILKSAPRQRTR